MTAEPAVAVREPAGTPRAVVLVLPGGRAESFDRTEDRNLAALRMRPIAAAIHRRGRRDGVAVWLLRYRYRGWNGTEMSPIADATWALDGIAARYGDVPVSLVGHSMGGRTALRVAGADSVVGAVALAPWLFDTEPIEQLRGRRIVIAHGTLDRVTSPAASRRYAQRAAELADVSYVPVAGETHAMLLRWPTWHRLAVRESLAMLAGQPASGRANTNCPTSR